METIQISKKRIGEFQKFIFLWWKKNARDLPWRHTADPYHILVSEIMLQQTQVSRGLPKYLAFLSRFPDVQHLADASVADVLREWKGLGYNRRALYLKKTAEAIVTNYHGIFPNTKKELMTLPGIGAYTAGAILVFAFRQDVSMVDTNIRRIMTHFFFTDTPQPEGVIEAVAHQLVPKGKSWEWHQALMDYGALELKHDIEKKGSPNRVKKDKKKSIPFIQTERYIRGRIMDELREKQWSLSLFVPYLASTYGRSEEAIFKTIERLQKDAIVVVHHDTISLPE
jgi:A/G-specific adenine glycosylase